MKYSLDHVLSYENEPSTGVYPDNSEDRTSTERHYGRPNVTRNRVYRGTTAVFGGDLDGKAKSVIPPTSIRKAPSLQEVARGPLHFYD